jgi:hypothetical protein
MDRDPNYPNNSTTRGTARLTECFDLSAATSVKLSFWAREFSDDLESQDGLFISGTGFGYTKILSFPDSFPVYQEFIVDVEQALVTAGITDRSQVYLRVQQYGHWAISFDGIAIDDFVVSGIGSITRC